MDDTDDANPLLLRTSKNIRHIISNYKNAHFPYRVDRTYMLHLPDDERRASMLRDLRAKSLQYTLVSIDVSHFRLDWSTRNHDPIGQINNSLEAVLMSNCTALKELTLVATGIDEWTALGTALRQCPALERLHISTTRRRWGRDCSATFDAVFTALCGNLMPNLTDIDFSDCRLSSVANLLAVQMPTYSALTKLNLSGNVIYRTFWNNADNNDVIRALPECHRLQHVDLSNNDLSRGSCDALVLALPSCTCLTHLDLSDNDFDSQCYHDLADSLALCTTLRSLSFRNSGSGTVDSFCSLVSRGGLSNLTYLNVSGCGIDCWDYFEYGTHGRCARELGLCTNLTQLSLSNNKLGDTFTNILLQSVLLSCRGLTHLDLAATKLTDDGVRGLPPLISRYPTLIRLNLTDNGLGAGTKARIQTSWNAVQAAHRDGLWM